MSERKAIPLPGEPEGKPFHLPGESCIYMDEVCEFFDNKYPGREGFVYHEIVSDLVHLDVHILYPTKDEPFFVVFTTGMSDLPMTMPEQMQEEEKSEYERAELYMLLPDTWNPKSESKTDTEMSEENYWAIRSIKSLARFPHDYKTWFGPWHTIANGADYEPPVEGSEMGGNIIASLGLEVNASDGALINLYMVMPASKAEVEFKLDRGIEALLDVFEKHDVPFVIDIFRKSVI